MKKAEKQAAIIASIASNYATYIERIDLERTTGEDHRSWIYREMLHDKILELKGLGIFVKDLIAVEEELTA